MLFNSFEYALFFPIVFILYWFATNRNLNLQNLLLLVASYIFYGFWDYRFVLLLMFSTLLDYFTGIKLRDAKNKPGKKFWLWLSICINVGFLGIFKYYNFFATSFTELLLHVGFKADFWTLKIILPVGISFYTFHGLSYVLDIYNDKIKPNNNFIEYAVFVSFFPLLVAGPIERATSLLPQIKKKRTFDYSKAIDGLRQMLWGFFKKTVIADNCAKYVALIFNTPSDHSGSTLLAGIFLFSLQMYGDFSGYSDIALGSARLLGIELLRNFSFPFFSRDIPEYWRRWHISLTTWFRDYLYIPLGGSRGSTWMKVRNVFIIFLVSGFWHGANWTFIAWGALNAIYFMPSLLSGKHRESLDTVAQGKKLPSLKDLMNMFITLTLISFSMIFFRSDTIEQAFSYANQMFSGLIYPSSYKETWKFFSNEIKYGILIMIALFIIIEWLGREQKHALGDLTTRIPGIQRLIFYNAIVVSILFFGIHREQFVYFQF